MLLSNMTTCPYCGKIVSYYWQRIEIKGGINKAPVSGFEIRTSCCNKAISVMPDPDAYAERVADEVKKQLRH